MHHQFHQFAFDRIMFEQDDAINIHALESLRLPIVKLQLVQPFELSASQPIDCNPFHNISDFERELPFILLFFNGMISDFNIKSALKHSEISVLSSALRLVFAKFGQNADITLLSNYLQNQSDLFANVLGEKLLPYSSMGIYRSWFSSQPIAKDAFDSSCIKFDQSLDNPTVNLLIILSLSRLILISPDHQKLMHKNILVERNAAFLMNGRLIDFIAATSSLALAQHLASHWFFIKKPLPTIV